MGVQPSTGLGRDHQIDVGTVLQQLPDEPLGPPVAVHVSGVDEGHTGIDCGVQRGHGIRVADGTPVTTDRPGAKTHLGDLESGAAERPVVHGVIPRVLGQVRMPAHRAPTIAEGGSGLRVPPQARHIGLAGHRNVMSTPLRPRHPWQ